MEESLNLREIRKESTDSPSLKGFHLSKEASGDKKFVSGNSSNREKETTILPQYKKTLLYFCIAVFIILSSIFLYFSAMDSENFYKGEWKSEISSENTKSGVTEIAYSITDDQIIQRIKTTGAEGIMSDIEIINKVSKTSTSSNLVTFTVSETKYGNINVDVPESVCAKSGVTCDEFKSKFIKNITNLTQNDISGKDTELRISRISNDQVYLIEGSSQIKLSR